MRALASKGSWQRWTGDKIDGVSGGDAFAVLLVFVGLHAPGGRLFLSSASSSKPIRLADFRLGNGKRATGHVVVLGDIQA